jgi:predicted ATPase/class 3 adenylate cyclase
MPSPHFAVRVHAGVARCSVSGGRLSAAGDIASLSSRVQASLWDGGGMRELPTGTVTFLFTDIEGSTLLWEEHPSEMEAALAQHDAILRAEIAEHSGCVFSTAGDSFAAAFARASDAVAAAKSAQERLTGKAWPEPVVVRVRMGLHSGEAYEREGDYFGPTVNRAARIMAAGHGGQVLLSAATAALIDGRGLVDLGEHRLKDLGEPTAIMQLEETSARFPPLRTLSGTRHNLPVERTALVGRDADMGAVVDLLAEHRLVTLTGIGGVGKTRLALAVAATVAVEQTFTDGVFFVDLSPLGSGDQLALAVAGSIGLQSGRRVDEDTLQFLAARRVLVILDNCEHLIDDAANFVDRILDNQGASRVLVTSREDLGIEGERTFGVASLSVDVGGAAVELLIDRSAAIGATQLLDDVNRAVLRDVAERLDGLPLALELAAAQFAHLAPVDLLHRLDQRFHLLSGGRGRRLQRQQTLQAVMDWSWELLSPAEQSLLARLAVFNGPWDLRAAEGACVVAGEPPITTTLRSLVHKSLVQRAGDAALSRYRLLETVRLYAQQKLVERGEADTGRSRHLAWRLAEVERIGLDVQLLSVEHATRYERDIDDIRAATDWAFAVGDNESAATLAIAGANQVFSAGNFGTTGLSATVDRLLGSQVSDTTRARLLAAKGWLLWDQHPDPPAVVRLSEQAITAARRSGDLFALAMGCVLLCMFSNDRTTWDLHVNEASTAAELTGSVLLKEAVDAFLLRNIGLPWIEPWHVIDHTVHQTATSEPIGVGRLSNLHSTVGSALVVDAPEHADWAIDQLIAIYRQLGVVSHPFHVPLTRALVAAHRQNLAAARALLREALDIEHASRAGPTRPDSLLIPALAAARAGNAEQCAAVLECVRTNPLGLGGGQCTVLYRHLRRQTTQSLDPERLRSAREHGRRLNPDDVLHTFLDEREIGDDRKGSPRD